MSKPLNSAYHPLTFKTSCLATLSTGKLSDLNLLNNRNLVLDLKSIDDFSESTSTISGLYKTTSEHGVKMLKDICNFISPKWSLRVDIRNDLSVMTLGTITSLAILKLGCCLSCLTKQGNGRMQASIPAFPYFQHAKGSTVYRPPCRRKGCDSDNTPCSLFSDQSSKGTGLFTSFCWATPPALQQHAASYSKQMSNQCPVQRKQCIVVNCKIYHTDSHLASFDCNKRQHSALAITLFLKLLYFCRRPPRQHVYTGIM